MTNIYHLLAFSVCTSAFQVQQGRTVRTSTALDMGLFDFKPIHGGGSGSSSEELEKQFEMQQEILKARRDHINFNSLHEKYSSKTENTEQHVSDVFSLGTEYKEDEYAKSHVDDDEGENKSFPGRNILNKFPWKLKP